MKIDNLWYCNEKDMSSEMNKYYNQKINDAIQWSKKPKYPQYYFDPQILEPMVVFMNGKNLILTSNEIGITDIAFFPCSFESKRDLVDELEETYSIKNLKTEYIGIDADSERPVFLCTEWYGEFKTENNGSKIVEIGVDELETIDVGSHLKNLMDCRGNNYHIWAALLRSSGYLI